RLVEEVAGGPAADGPAAEQLGGDQLDGPPVPVLGEQVFGLGEQTAFEPFGLALAGPPHGQVADVPQVAVGLVPAVGAAVAGLGRGAAPGAGSFGLAPALPRPGHAL